MDAPDALAFKEALRQRCLSALARRRRARWLRPVSLAAALLLALGAGLWAGRTDDKPPRGEAPSVAVPPAWLLQTRPLQGQQLLQSARVVEQVQERSVSWVVQHRTVSMVDQRSTPTIAADNELLALFPEQPLALVGGAGAQRVLLLVQVP